MPDFILEPDEPDLDRPERSRPVRMVGTGLAPTADVPAVRTKGPEPAPAYHACPCGGLVLEGLAPQGEVVVLDPRQTCYTVLWEPGAPRPTVARSRAYPVHKCVPRL